MKALITGVTGFIGSHVAELILRREGSVLGVARQDWSTDLPDNLRDGVDLLRWDIRLPSDEVLLRRVADFAPDVILHFAGLSIPASCGHDTPTALARHVNVDGTRHLLRLCEQLPDVPRFVFSSTCHVYGNVEASDPIVGEESPIQARNAYAQTKLECEQLISEWARQTSADTCLVRGFHHIGPRQPSGLMLTDWIDQIVPGCTELSVRSTNSFLDLVDVRDAAEAYYLLATTQSCPTLCNLGSGQAVRSGDVLDALRELVGYPLSVRVMSEQPHWNPIADISILKSLDWQPRIHYEQSICDMMASQR